MNMGDGLQYAKAELDASRKNLWDCQERERITHEAYLTAVRATSEAYRRERDAFHTWFAVTRPRYQDIENAS